MQRNYMKRVLRELFRKNQDKLKNVDIIIRAQKLFGPAQYPAVEQEFHELIARLNRQTHQVITPLSS